MTTKEGMSVKEVVQALLETTDNDSPVTVSVNGIPGFEIQKVVDNSDDQMTVVVGTKSESEVI